MIDKFFVSRLTFIATQYAALKMASQTNISGRMYDII